MSRDCHLLPTAELSPRHTGEDCTSPFLPVSVSCVPRDMRSKQSETRAQIDGGHCVEQRALPIRENARTVVLLRKSVLRGLRWATKCMFLLVRPMLDRMRWLGANGVAGTSRMLPDCSELSKLTGAVSGRKCAKQSGVFLSPNKRLQRTLFTSRNGLQIRVFSSVINLHRLWLEMHSIDTSTRPFQVINDPGPRRTGLSHRPDWCPSMSEETKYV